MATYTGGTGADAFIGTDAADYMSGRDGDDTLSGNSGDDLIVGGRGDDLMSGGDGNDTAGYATATAAVSVDLRIAGVQDTLGAGHDTLSAFENLTGSGFADYLYGNAAANILDGGGGDDVMAGFAGNDVYLVDSDADIITEAMGEGTDEIRTTLAAYTLHSANVENLRALSAFGQALTGNSASNVIVGSGGGDVLSGLGGNDSLYGLGGNDLLDGGTGDDKLNGDVGADAATYASATSGVTVSLAVTAAQDTGAAGMDTLSGIENLIGSAYNDTLTGNSGDNTIDGGDGDDRIDGGSGNDTVSYASATARVTAALQASRAQATGGAGSDTLASVENLVGSAYNDYLLGSVGDNVLVGGAGDDTLSPVGDLTSAGYGVSGNDTFDGGAGEDAVVFSRQGAVSINLAFTGPQATDNGNTATFISIEDISGSGYADVLIGSAGDNILYGHNGPDILYGGAGNDILWGENGADTLSGGPGNDRLVGGDNGRRDGSDRATYADATAGVTLDLNDYYPQDTGGAGIDELYDIADLTGSSFNDLLLGDAHNNAFDGGAGDDALRGGAGNDRMDGGTGTDRASYSDAISGVTVNLSLTGAQSTGGAGSDTLISIESLTGSGYADTLVGSAAANAIEGGAGDDVLDGGLGADTIEGETGHDTIRFSTTLGSNNIDTIRNFSVEFDTIALDHDVFAGLGVGALSAGAYVRGTMAHDAGDRIIYNQTAGALLFDSDGSGSTYAAVQFATVATGLAITAADFTIV